MKINADQLSSQLKGAPQPMYTVSGDEPLLVNEAEDAILAYLKSQGFEDRRRLTVGTGFDWEELMGLAAHGGLFSQRQIVHLTLPTGKPGNQGSKVLQRYVAQPPRDTVLLLSTAKVDKKAMQSAWVKALLAAGLWVQVWPVSVEQLPGWLQMQFKAAGLTVEPEALRLLAERVEGNLLAASQAVARLQLLNHQGTVTRQDMAMAVGDSARFDVFTLTDSVLNGDSGRALRILQGVRAEGVQPAVVLWALARELRTLLRLVVGLGRGQPLSRLLEQLGVWPKRRPLLAQAVKRFRVQQWSALLLRAGRIDALIKGVEAGNVWQALERLCLSMAGGR